MGRHADSRFSLRPLTRCASLILLSRSSHLAFPLHLKTVFLLQCLCNTRRYLLPPHYI